MSLQKEKRKKERIKFLTAFVVLLIIEIVIAIYIHDTFIRPYVGDVLVVIVLFCAIRVITPDKYKLLWLWIFIFAAFVECLQYFNLVQVLGVEENMFLRILIGSTFDIKDIGCYGFGCILIGIYEWRKMKPSN